MAGTAGRETCDLVSRGFAPVYVNHSAVRVIGQRCVRDSGFNAAAARFNDVRARPILRAKYDDLLLNSTGTGTIGESCIFHESATLQLIVMLLFCAHHQRLIPRWLNALLVSPFWPENI